MTDQPTTTAQCGACGGLNGQHWHRCPDRDETAAPGPHTDQPDTSSLHARLCRMLGAAQDAADDDLIETVRGMCVRTQDAFLLGTHDIEVCNRDREQARRQLEHIAAAPSNADMWARLGMALGWDPLRAGLAARDRRSLAERYADARAAEFEKALTAAKAENDGWAETTRNTDRLTSQQLAEERAAHEEHRQQLAAALGEGDTEWGYILNRAAEIREGRDRADDTSTRLSREVTSLREGIGQLRAEGEQVRTAVCDALGGNLVDWPEAISRVRKGIADRDGQRAEVRRLRSSDAEHHRQLADALGEAPRRDWEYLLRSAGASRAEAVQRATVLHDARDALGTAGHAPDADDWPAVAPAIRKLTAEIALIRGNDEVNRREASNRREALAKTLRRGPGADWYAIHAAAAEAVRRAETAEQEARDARQGETEAVRARKAAEQLAENMQSRATAMETRAETAIAARDEAILRAETSEAAMEHVRKIASRLAAHAQGFRDVLDEVDHGPWGRTVGADITELTDVLGGVSEQAEPESDDSAPDRALAEVERLAVELYQAEDTLAWIGELCDIADRTDRAVTTADVRAWLRGPQCARQAYLVITEGPLAEALRAALPDGGA